MLTPLMRASLAATAIGLLAGSLPAQEGPPTAAKAVKEKKICRNIVATGTIMGRRFCLTKSEWAEFDERNDKHNEFVRDKRMGVRQEQ